MRPFLFKTLYVETDFNFDSRLDRWPMKRNRYGRNILFPVTLSSFPVGTVAAAFWINWRRFKENVEHPNTPNDNSPAYICINYFFSITWHIIFLILVILCNWKAFLHASFACTFKDKSSIKSPPYCGGVVQSSHQKGTWVHPLRVWFFVDRAAVTLKGPSGHIPSI